MFGSGSLPQPDITKDKNVNDNKNESKNFNLFKDLTHSIPTGYPPVKRESNNQKYLHSDSKLIVMIIINMLKNCILKMRADIPHLRGD